MVASGGVDDCDERAGPSERLPSARLRAWREHGRRRALAVTRLATPGQRPTWAGGLPARWQQRRQVDDAHSAGETGQDVGEVRDGIDVVEHIGDRFSQRRGRWFAWLMRPAPGGQFVVDAVTMFLTDGQSIGGEVSRTEAPHS